MNLTDLLCEATQNTLSMGEDHFVINIEQNANDNRYFRRVLFTARDMQLVVMSLKPGEEIGSETHESIDQFFRVESGNGKVFFNGVPKNISSGSAFIIPQGVKHNVVNTSETDDLKLYTVYAPPNHMKDTVHKTRKDAVGDKEHFDGNTDVVKSENDK